VRAVVADLTGRKYELPFQGLRDVSNLIEGARNVEGVCAVLMQFELVTNTPPFSTWIAIAMTRAFPSRSSAGSNGRCLLCGCPGPWLVGRLLGSTLKQIIVKCL